MSDITYFYRIERGRATLAKGDDAPIKTIGHFASDALAKQACVLHFQKVAKACANFGRPAPPVFYL